MTAGLEEVRCVVCLDPYSQHEDDGGHCTAVKGDHERFPCPCPGFRWVDVDGPHVGSYTDPPQRP